MLEPTRFPHALDASSPSPLKSTAEPLPANSLSPVAPELPELPDLLLVERIRARDVRAFETLMKRYNRRLYRLVRSIVPDAVAAEECVRAVYLRACESLDRYEPTGKFGAWLTRLAFNEALGARRPPASGSAQVAQDDQAAAQRRALEAAIDSLPVVFRTVLVMRVVEGMSGVEVAACLGLNETTVRTRLHRAQQRLNAERIQQLRADPANIFALWPENAARIIATVTSKLRWA